MSSEAVRTNCLDASALVKYYINEPGSDELAAFLKDQANWYTTPFCVYEGLNVLKRKKLRREISAEEYYRAGFAMSADYAVRTRGMNDINFFDPLVFAEVETLCRKHSLDFSDAFQILSVKSGYYAIFVGDSQTVLVTADRALSKAAEAEGLKVKLLLDGSTDRPKSILLKAAQKNGPAGIGGAEAMRCRPEPDKPELIPNRRAMSRPPERAPANATRMPDRRRSAASTR